MSKLEVTSRTAETIVSSARTAAVADTCRRSKVAMTTYPYAHFQVARHGVDHRCMIDRSMRACLAAGSGAVPHTVTYRRRRGEGPPLLHKEKGGRDLLAREVIRLTIVVYVPRRHDYHARARRGESLRRVSLPHGHARVMWGPVEHDAPSTWSAVPRAVSEHTSHYLPTLTCRRHILLLAIINRRESFICDIQLTLSCGQ